MQPTPAPSSAPGSPKTPPPEEQPATYPPPPSNKGSAPFHVLIALFEKLQTERKPDKRRKLLASWFDHWRKEIGHDLYPVLRLILPQKDRERSVYGLKELALAKLYRDIMVLSNHDPDVLRMTHWKKPTERDKTSGDFPTVLYEVVYKRSSVVEGSLSIDDVNEILDRLAKATDNKGKKKALTEIYSGATPEEQKWIVRIILKDMVISVKENTVFGVFHPDAYDLFNTCSDLKKVVWELWDPARRLKDEDKAVRLFRAFAPMLCKRPTRKIEDSIKEMGSRGFIIEEKLDGERMQLHKRGNEYFYCSRKGKDYTYLYGKHVGTGSLTPFINSAFDERVDEIILDGEMLVWDPVTQRNLPFGNLKTHAKLDVPRKDQNPRPCFRVFDLLYLNGTSLLHKSTKFRKRNLRSCFKEVTGRLEYVPQFEGKTAKDVRTKMDEIMANRGEGLILKHPDAEYVLNGRNKDWIKVKPEYMDNMGETVDVLVVAGNYGTGRRSGGVSTLICAVLDDRRVNHDDEDLKYSTFVRIGTGLSYTDYIWIRERPWKPWGRDGPDWLQTARKGHDDKGDCYLEPEDSFIIKVKAAEITTSDQYHTGFTMRFPRAIGIRQDLTVADCMTVTSIIDSMRSEKKRKMEDEEEKPKKKPKKTAKVPTIMPEYQGGNIKNTPIKSQLFEAYKFMVSSDPKSRTGTQDKQALLQMIHAHSGKYVQFARDDPNLLVVYGGQTTPYDLKLVMNKDVCDIIRPQWVLDCVAKEEIVPLTKKYFFHATTARKETEAYSMEDNDTEDEEEPVPSASPGSSGQSNSPGAPGPSNLGKEEKPKSEIDPSMAEWFDLGAKVNSAKGAESDSETEPESDEPEPDSENEDIRDAAAITLDDEDDWEHVQKESGPEVSDGKGKNVDVQMGETEDAMEYDEERIFRHLCFYLDSPSNAKKLGMTVKAKKEEDVEKRFEQISKVIVDNGGRVVDLDEPKLTHVVLDKRDISRRQELMKRTAQPKRRHLVIAEFIELCIEEGTLLDEDEFMP